MKTGLFQTIRMEWANAVSSAGEAIAFNRGRRKDSKMCWLVVRRFRFNGSFGQYLPIRLPERERENEKAEVINENKNKQLTPETIASAAGPCPTIIHFGRRLALKGTRCHRPTRPQMSHYSLQ